MNYAVLDFETTGNGPNDQVIQVGLALIDNRQITRIYSSMVRPTVPIPAFITELTGIREEDVAEAPEIEQVIAEMLPLLADRILVAHNAAFDVGFLQRLLDECGYAPFAGPVLDTLDVVRMLYPGMASLQLSMICYALDIHHDRPHQADSDAEVTARIWLHCMDKLDELPLLTMQRLTDIIDGQAVPAVADLSWWLTQMLRARESNPVPDPGEARYPFRQFSMAVPEWSADEEEDAESRQDRLPGQFEDYLADIRQRLAESFGMYEERAAQQRMIQEVYDSLEQSKHLLIEAGTGTGKSLGYLIPAIYFSIKHEKKVTISTHTINLQEQLRARDLPLLESIVPVPFRAEILKGRSHYVCLRKLEQKLNGKQYEWTKEDLVTAAQTAVWLSETKTGDDEELHLSGRSRDFWHSVASDADSCLNRACPWFRRCFYHRARNAAHQADIVITNHSMVFTDMKAESRLLPAYDQLVIDEAHHFEEVASNHLGITVTYYNVVNAMQWLFRDAKTGQIPGLLSALAFSGHEMTEKWTEQVNETVTDVMAMKEEWEELADLTFQTFMGRMDASSGEPGMVVRLRKQSLPGQWNGIVQLGENWHLRSGNLLRKLESAAAEIKEACDDFQVQSVITDLTGTLKELRQIREQLNFFLTMEDDAYVYWLEAHPVYRTKSLQLTAAPIDVSPILRASFFEAKESIVMTSATLSVNQKFDYLEKQVGLDTSRERGRLATVQLESPFNYRKNVLVCIPRDFPKLKGIRDEQPFIDKLIESLANTAESLNGKMLVLFTSYRMLRQVYDALKERLAPNGIQVIGQGVDSNNRSKLTRWFMDSPAGVLLGTSSFWEGVDIPGESLSCLAIVRLPFQPPNHPLVEAKCELLKEQGRNPFMDYSVPQAVIRFKQGFGRLIRTATDRGVVIIYDTRVIDTFYGKHFLYSLPGPKIEHMSGSQMVDRVQSWFGQAELKETEEGTE